MNSSFDLVRFFTNECEETQPGSGVFVCASANRIAASQSLSASGATDLAVTLHSKTPVETDGTAFVLAQTGGSGGVSLTQSATGQEIRGAADGIVARNTSGGSISISVNGSVTGGSGDGLRAYEDASGTGIAITAADVSGARSGIVALSSGTSDVTIHASGHVAGASGDGILVERSGSGSTSFSVSGTVTGGSGTDVAAIRTDVGSENAVGISLRSGASVGAGGLNAIIGSAGNTSVTVNAGAVITGKIRLGAGTDTLVFDGGAFGSATEVDGGSGTDILTFRSGSGTLHASVASEGLKGWESVIVESGAALAGEIRLADDSGNLTFESGSSVAGLTRLDGGGGSDNTLSFNGVAISLPTAVTMDSFVTGWENLVIGTGSKVSVGAGAWSLSVGTLRLDGTFDAGENASADDSLRLDGNFVGGGKIILNANFVDGGSDVLTITGSAAGTTSVVVSPVGSLKEGGSDNDRPERISGVVAVGGSAQSNAFVADTVDFGAVSYRLEFNGTNSSFDLVRFFTNECEETRPGSGVFACASANRIGASQSLSASGSTALNVTLDSETPVETDGTAFVLAQIGGSGGISLTQSATGREIKGDIDGISARNTGGGSISISVNGSVTGGSGDGLRAYEDASGTGIAITAADVSGARSGIVAISSGTGEVAIHAPGHVAGASGDGIFVERSGSGSTRLSVSGTVTGGSGTGVAAIRTDVGSGNAVGISLRSGASVGSGGLNAIIGSAGNTSVTVNAGAVITGKVRLGAGADALVFDGGTFGSATEVDGGSGTDILTFRSGSGTLHASVASKGLKGWESVIVESGAALNGAIKLADDSGNLTFESGSSVAGLTRLDGGGGSDNTLSFNGVAISLPTAVTMDSFVTGWESLVIGTGSKVRVGAGAWSLSVGTLRLDGTFDAGENASAGDSLRLDGNFVGGGKIILNANFVDGGSDVLTITGSAAGTTSVVVSPVGNLKEGGSDNDRPERISGVVAVGGSVQSSAFVADTVDFGAVSYRLEFNGTNSSFDLVRFFTNACEETQPGSGVFACASANRIGASQSLSASGATALNVTLDSETPVKTDGTAFVLAQIGGSGGVSLTQSATGREIKGDIDGISARNTGGGSISISVNGSVTGGSGDGLRAYEDASGTGIAITAADVSGARSGIVALSSGTGDVTVHASGQIAGGSGDGIFIERSGSDSGSTSFSVSGTVTGGSGTGVAAIRTDVGSGNAVGISLRSGASVGSGDLNAIIGSAGNTSVTVNTGATIIGKVRLGAGTDALVFDGGAFGSATEIDGGAGSDTLTFSGGSGSLHAAVQSEGLKGWESVVVKSGATIRGSLTLAADSRNLIIAGSNIGGLTALDGGEGVANVLALNGVSGSLAGATVTGWEAISVGSDTAISFGTGAHALTAGILSVSGTLDVGSDSDTADALTLTGNFAGGGKVTLNANFVDGGSDSLTISGDATGTTKVVIGRVGQLSEDGDRIVRPERISGVIAVRGSVSSSAFTADVAEFGAIGYRLEFDLANKRFDLVRFFTNECIQASGNGQGGGSGVFSCSGVNRIGEPQALDAAGTTSLSVTLDAQTPVDTTGAAFTLRQSGGSGGVSFTQASGGRPITGAADAIAARNSGGGAIRIDVNGSVTAVGGYGIRALDDADGAGITITAADVFAADGGIVAVSSGTGAVSVRTTGTVTTASGTGIYGLASGAGALSIRVSDVSGGGTGVKAVGNGSGNVIIVASGDVSGKSGDGISVKRAGAGGTRISVSGSVTGGSGGAAIRTDAQSGDAVGILLGSGASVGSGIGAAIVGSGGDTAVTVNSGAKIVGRVSLGSGTDTLTFAGGTFSDVTEMDGGAGDSDTLTFSGGSGSLHATVQLQGLKGWESVVVQSGAALSGAIKLADDSGNLTLDETDIGSIGTLSGGGGSANTLALNGVSGTLNGANVTGWETVSVGAGSRISFGSGTHAVTAGTLSVSGTLDVGSDSDSDDTLALSGDFRGGGTITLDADFVDGDSDSLTITGDASGTTRVVIDSLGSLGDGDADTDRPLRISGLIGVGGNVSPGAFSAAIARFGAVAYRLEHNAAGRSFDLVRFFTNMCRAAGDQGSGVFSCSGSHRIGAPQALGASGSISLNVTLNSETPVDTTGTAFALAQSGGDGGIVFTQSATGLAIRGADDGIAAVNSGGGTISIDVNGSVTAAGGDGIRASNDASGTGVAITAASVWGAESGIVAAGSGTGSVSIVATGRVTGTGAGGTGVRGHSAAGAGSLNITVATVTGSATGISAMGEGSGTVAIRATGAVTAIGSGGIGIRAVAGARAGALSVSAANVDGAADGVKVTASGSGAVVIAASGAVSGRSGDGIFVERSRGGHTQIAVSGSVTGGAADTVAAIRTNAGSGGSVSVSLESGASVGAVGRNAIIGSAGNASVTVGAGAAIAGAVKLGAGRDELVFAGGAFSDVTEMDGGAGRDTLRFSDGSGTLNRAVVSAGLKNWESVVVESGAAISGAIRLADSSGDLVFEGSDVGGLAELDGGSGTANTLSLNNVSGTLDGANLLNWETVEIGAKSRISLGAGAHALTAGTLSLSGTLDVGDDGDTGDLLSLRGNFAGGGAIVLDANFAAGGSDRLAISGNVTGSTKVVVDALGALNAGQTDSDRPERIDGVISVQGSVSANAFAFAGMEFGTVDYRLEFNSARRRFDLVRHFTNQCRRMQQDSGVFACRGEGRIGSSQKIQGSGGSSLVVMVSAEALLDTSGAALSMTQSGTSAGIMLNQMPGGREIKGASDAIMARNSGGGAISINVNGSVTASGGDGIHAVNDSGGDEIRISAASVTGSNIGIRAHSSGTGAVMISATGAVNGAGDMGVYARTAPGGGGIAVTAAAVTGAMAGIKAMGSGTGKISVMATGAVAGSGSAGIEVHGGAAATGVSVAVATVTGRTGIMASHSGSGTMSISATAAISGMAGDGILAMRTAPGATRISVSGSVTGGAGAGTAAIRTDVMDGAEVMVSLDSGASVGTVGRNAVIGGAGSTTLMAGVGAAIRGAVNLGAGGDEMIFADGAFSEVTEMDGGTGVDMLRFNGGSGSLHEDVQSEGLKGWESVMVESGASISGTVRLAESSRDLTFNGGGVGGVTMLDGGAGADNTLALNDMSATLAEVGLTGWERIEIGAGSVISLGAGDRTLTSQVAVPAGATLDVGADADTTDVLTVAGLAGGGTVRINANFNPSGHGADKLVVNGGVTGTTTISVMHIGASTVGSIQEPSAGTASVMHIAAPALDSVPAGIAGVMHFAAPALDSVPGGAAGVMHLAAPALDSVPAETAGAMQSGASTAGSFHNRPARIAGVISVGSGAAVSADSFTASPIMLGPVGYRLEFVEANGSFDLVRFFSNQCAAQRSGVVTCSGTDVIGGPQAFTASGSTALAVSLASQTPVDVTGAAFSLTQSGTAGIRFVQEAGGRTIKGTESGLLATNSGGGSVRIVATGSITAGADGVVVSSDSSGAEVSVGVASVSGGDAGVSVAGGGGVSVVASGPVSGASGPGVDIRGARGDVTVQVGQVSGGTHGIAVTQSGGGSISVTATGAVAGIAGDGIQVRSSGTGDVRIEVSARVEGGASANRAAINSAGASGTARIVLASGADVRAGTNGTAILADHGAVEVMARTGSSIAGPVRLGAGSDELVFAGGGFDRVASLDGERGTTRCASPAEAERFPVPSTPAG